MSNDVVSWVEELARQAKEVVASERMVGKFFSISAGQLKFGGEAVPGNQIAVVIADAIRENVYYEGRYDSDNPTPPVCFAFGRDEKTMAPHEEVVARGVNCHVGCAGCPNNQWASADTGKGKACRNVRRLALLAAGTIDAQTGVFEPFDALDHFMSSPPMYLRLPVTSVGDYTAYVNKIANVFKVPPYAFYTKLRVVPDSKTQFKVSFAALGVAPDGIIPTLVNRHAQLAQEIEFPYAPSEVKVEKKPRRF